MQLAESSVYRRIVWWSALYDFVLSAGFAVPLLAALKIELLRDLHVALGLAGAFPAFDPVHVFFVNLFGTIVTLWSVIRLRHPLPDYGLYDAIGRTLFSAWMVFYLMGGGTMMLAFFLVPEMLWGIVQFVPWLRSNGGLNRSGPAGFPGTADPRRG